MEKKIREIREVKDLITKEIIPVDFFSLSPVSKVVSRGTRSQLYFCIARDYACPSAEVNCCTQTSDAPRLRHSVLRNSNEGRSFHIRPGSLPSLKIFLYYITLKRRVRIGYHLSLPAS
jgi:hypothetical protein